MVRTLRYAVLCSLLIGTVRADIQQKEVKANDFFSDAYKIIDTLTAGLEAIARKQAQVAENGGEPVPGEVAVEVAEKAGNKVAAAAKEVAGNFGAGIRDQDGRTPDGMPLAEAKPIGEEKTTKSVFSNAGAYCTAAATKAAALVVAHPYAVTAVALVAVWTVYKLKCASYRKAKFTKTVEEELAELEQLAV